MTSTNGGCVVSTVNGGGIQFWDIQPGKTYIIRLSNVTECGGQTIPVTIQSSAVGNIATTATRVTGNTYQTAPVTIPLTFCQTAVVSYCNVPPGTPTFAQDVINGAGGGNNGHLRAALFTPGTCNVTNPPTIDCLSVSASATPGQICAGQGSAQMNAIASGGQPPYMFSWSPAAGLSNPNIANPVATPSVTTTYTVTVTDSIGRTATATATVVVNPTPSVTITGAPTGDVCPNTNSITMTANPSVSVRQ